MLAVQIDRFFLKPKKEGAGVDVPQILSRNHLKSAVADSISSDLVHTGATDDINFRLMKARLQAIPRGKEDPIVPYVPVIGRILKAVETAESSDDL